MSTDEIQKQILLKAPIERVWSAITETQKFGAWFGMKLKGDFCAGKITYGEMAMTQMNDEIAKMQEPFQGFPVELHVQDMKAPKTFSFKWHVYAEGLPLNEMPMTLVTFNLEEKGGETFLTIVESGFDKLPPALKKQSFDGNSEGWAHQCKLLEAFLQQEG